jgi:hypothetical protein
VDSGPIRGSEHDNAPVEGYPAGVRMGGTIWRSL